MWHDILYHYSPTDNRIYEDGNPVLHATRDTPPLLIEEFTVWVRSNIHAPQENPTAMRFKNLKALPGTLRSGRPANAMSSADGDDLVFNKESSATNSQWIEYSTSEFIFVEYKAESMWIHTGEKSE
jgi:hypothetical protein